VCYLHCTLQPPAGSVIGSELLVCFVCRLAWGKGSAAATVANFEGGGTKAKGSCHTTQQTAISG
jgi:hypothetical protein